MKTLQIQSILSVVFLILILVLSACGGGVPASDQAPEAAEEMEEIEELEEASQDAAVVEEVAEEVEEALEEEVELAVTLEAVGSEEDDGSPFVPTGLSKTGDSSEDEAETLAWLVSGEANIEEPTARVLLNHVEDLVIVHTIRSQGSEEQIILAKSLLLYQQTTFSTTQQIEPELIYLPLSLSQWLPIAQEADAILIDERNDPFLCIVCSDETGETVYILTPDQSITFELDIDQELGELADFLTGLRDIRVESRVRARTTLGQVE